MKIIDSENKRSLFSGALYVAINNDFSSANIRHKSLALAKAVAGNGCDILQYRARNLSYYKMLDEAKSIADICVAKNIPLIVNNHIDLALDIDSDGVHLSEKDVSITQARAIIGKNKILGLTVRNSDDLIDCNFDALDYITIAGIFAVEKGLNPIEPLGIVGLKNLIKNIKKQSPNLPIVGIGGITDTNMPEILNLGIDSISVIGAISQAPKPIAVCKKLKKILIKSNKNNQH